MQIVIHRGTHQIGGTCVEVVSGKTRIILDYGMPLTDVSGKEFNDRSLQDKSVAELIKERVLFDIPGLYKGQELQVDGILISHSHKDHYGLLNYLNPDIPVYISEGALKLINVLNVFTHKQSHVKISRPRKIRHKASFNIGDFQVTPYLVDHSGFDAMSYLIEETRTGKRLFYSGDFRASGWKRVLFDRFIKNPPKNINCLLMEGTMVEREAGKYPTERDVLDRMVDILRSTDYGMTFACCSGQNIDRIVTFYKAARRSNTLLIIDPYTACVLNAIKTPQGHIPQMDWRSTRVFIANYYGKGDIYVSKINDSAFRHILPQLARAKIKPMDFSRLKQKAIVLMRGSMIPALEKIPNIKGSKMVYSQWQGYLEKDNPDARRLKEFVSKYDLDLEHVHTSGHATVDMLKQLKESMMPEIVIPIHTRYPDRFKHYFGKNVLTVSDGQQIRI